MRVSQKPQPVSLRVSVTDRCDLRCTYCLPPDGAKLATHDDVLRLEEIAAFVRFVQRRFGLTKVHLTGGEPLVRRGIVDLVRMLADAGAADLAMTTNGQPLREMALALRQAGLARINISLDTLDVETYRTLTRGGDLGRVLDGIAAAGLVGFDPIKFNMVVLRGVNDREVVPIARFALERGGRVRFLELMPIGVAQRGYEERFISSAEVRAQVASAFELRPLPPVPGASSRDYRAIDADGREGVVGFISPCTEPFCAGCRRLRLTATGRLLGCLARAEGPQVRSLLRDGAPDAEERLVEAVDEALRLKRYDRRFNEQRLMGRVGG